MPYVDGFVTPVPRKNLAAYCRLSRRAGKVWKEHGALEYRECAGDDLATRGVSSFPRALRAKPGETIVFAWIAYRSRRHRDQVNARVMNDPRIAKMCNPNATPFDVKRMLYGGFRVVVDL